MRTNRLKFIVVGAAALTVLAVAPAAAAPKASNGPTGSIDLMPAASAAVAASAQEGATSYSYGSAVSFETTLEGRVSNKAKVFVTVSCLQDDALVYRYSGSRDFNFPLLDQQGYEWDGGAADCQASLIYWVEKGKSIDYNVLDTVAFDVTA